MITAQKIEQARLMIGELAEIQNRPLQHAAQDMAEWMSVKLPRLNELLDEAQQEREAQDNQRELVFDFNNVIDKEAKESA